MAKKVQKSNKKSKVSEDVLHKKSIFTVLGQNDVSNVNVSESSDTTVVKKKTLFEHLSGLKELKVSWESLSEMDKKTFDVYIVNRFLSMDMDIIEIVNILQQYKLSQREVYKIYLELLPKKRTFSKYIKGDKEDKYHPKVIEYLCKYYQVSKNQIIEYMEFMNSTNIIDIIKKYGVEETQIEKWLKE